MVLNADRDLYQSEVALKDYLSKIEHGDKAGAGQYLTVYKENKRQAYDRMVKARELASIEGVLLIPDSHESFSKAFKAWEASTLEVLRLSDQDKLDEAYSLITGEQVQLFEQLRTYYDKFGEEVGDQQTNLTHLAHAIEKHSKK